MLVAPLFLADSLVGRNPRVIRHLGPDVHTYVEYIACTLLRCTSALRKHIQALDVLDESGIIVTVKQLLSTTLDEDAWSSWSLFRSNEM